MSFVKFILTQSGNFLSELPDLEAVTMIRNILLSHIIGSNNNDIHFSIYQGGNVCTRKFVFLSHIFIFVFFNIPVYSCNI